DAAVCRGDLPPFQPEAAAAARGGVVPPGDHAVDPLGASSTGAGRHRFQLRHRVEHLGPPLRHTEPHPPTAGSADRRRGPAGAALCGAAAAAVPAAVTRQAYLLRPMVRRIVGVTNRLFDSGMPISTLSRPTWTSLPEASTMYHWRSSTGSSVMISRTSPASGSRVWYISICMAPGARRSEVMVTPSVRLTGSRSRNQAGVEPSGAWFNWSSSLS